MGINISYHSSEDVRSLREQFVKVFKQCPIPDNEILSNLGLFIRRPVIARILLMNDLYQKIVNVPGIIMEFGVRWGQSLALFESFRGLYEPFNLSRKIVGFDTFEGFPLVDSKDRQADIAKKGAFSVTRNYEEYLTKILDYHEQEAPMSHIKKYELLKGDASVEIDNYLNENPETIIALAYFDFDIYLPTKKCLEAIKGHLTKGSVVAFDELHLHEFPGETLALKEVIGLDKYRLVRSPYSAAHQAYMVIE
jgi:hypothetical protein